MQSRESVKLPPIVNTNNNREPEKKERTSERESNSSSTSSNRKFRSFKQVVNIVGKNSKWTRDRNKEVQEDQLKNITSEVDKRLSFNVSAFKAHVRSVGRLSSEVKKALKKSSWHRTSKDLTLIQNVIMRIKAFETYSMALKTELSRVLLYQKFEKGRVVVQQGHLGVSFYFIVSGILTVQREEKDNRTHEKHIQCLGEMSVGDAFGELAFQNSTRTATIVCKTDCEFLKIDTEDFNQVLRNSQQFDFEKKMMIFKDQVHFEKWSMQEIRSANANSKVMIFPANSIILKDNNEDYVYFVQSGRCKLIREVTVVKTKLPFGKSHLALVPLSKTPKLSKEQILEKRYLVLMRMCHGGYFGVGEDLDQTWIISEGKVECLLVKRSVFKKHDGGRELALLREKLISSLPTRREAFRSYIKERNWRKYKKALIDELVRKRCKPLNTKYQDIPHVIRRSHEHYIRKL